MDDNLLHGDITKHVIGAAFEVHNFLGNGFQEVIYQRALAYELSKIGLNFIRESEQEIYYKDMEVPIGLRRADFVIEKTVLVELKAVSKLEDVHLAQTLNYLRAYKYEIGLLINFGAKKVEFKRLILSQKSV